MRAFIASCAQVEPIMRPMTNSPMWSRSSLERLSQERSPDCTCWASCLTGLLFGRDRRASRGSRNAERGEDEQDEGRRCAS